MASKLDLFNYRCRWKNIEDINGMILGGGNKGKGGSIPGGMHGGK